MCDTISLEAAGHTSSAPCSGVDGCGREEAAYFAHDAGLKTLLESANKIREAHFGNKIELCAIINAKSGNCGMDCRFCAQSRHNRTGVATFPLLPASELRQRVDALRPYPVRRCGIVTSGASLADGEFDALLAWIAEERGGKPLLCASLGRLKPQQLEKLRDAGLERYHHNLESSQRFYPALCTTQRWQERAATVRAARRAGLQVCCGGLFGAGESWADRIHFAFELKKLGIDNIPLNFLHPHPGTPLAAQPVLMPDEALRIIALFRHILPYATLRVCGGRTLALADKEEYIFSAGANALMSGNYLTTQGQGLEHDLRMLRRLGLEAAHVR